MTYDPTDKRALFQRVVDDILDRIRAGTLNPGDRLPSAKEISEGWDVSAMTAQRALRELQALGLSYGMAGKGSFVHPDATDRIKLLDGQPVRTRDASPSAPRSPNTCAPATPSPPKPANGSTTFTTSPKPPNSKPKCTYSASSSKTNANKSTRQKSTDTRPNSTPPPDPTPNHPPPKHRKPTTDAVPRNRTLPSSAAGWLQTASL